MARFDLTDREWSIIAPLLPNKPRGVARTDDRRVLNGIFYTLRTGSPWRDLPERYGPYTTAYNRYNRWAKAGVWLRIFETLAARSPQSLQFIDSSIGRAHQHAAGGEKGPGSRHWPFSWRTEHQDPCRRRRTGTAGQAGPVRRPGHRQDRSADPHRDPAAGQSLHRRSRIRRTRSGRDGQRQGWPGPHPDPKQRQAPALRRSRPLQAAQPHRALLQQAQALPTHRHPLRQARPKLPRRRRPRVSPNLDQDL